MNHTLILPARNEKETHLEEEYGYVADEEAVVTLHSLKTVFSLSPQDNVVDVMVWI